MKKQSLMPSKVEDTIAALLAARNRHDTVIFIILFVVLLSLTPLLTLWGMSTGLSVVLGILIALVLAVSLVRWPILGLYLIAASAFMIEQESLVGTPIVTDQLPIFYWPPQLEGFIERPIGVLFLIALFLWILPRFVQRRPLLKGGALIGPFAFYMLCVLGGVIYGLATKGDLKFIVIQFRPFWYTFLSYILAYNFVTRKSHVRNFFWLVIIGAGVKAFQGLYIYLVLFHGDTNGHDTIMSHEESFFFAALLLLIVIFCLHHRYWPQLIAALCIAPAVVIALVANNRRADYTALLIGIGVAWLEVFLIKPKARKALLTLMIISVILGGAYVVAFAHGSGTLAAPAHAIMATFNPSSSDTRDVSSNLYRLVENDDLKFTINHYPLGLGFGKPFLQPYRLDSVFPDILAADPNYNIVPHNTIYWIWVDLGPIGYFALWFLFGSIVIQGTVIVRKLKDPYLQVVGIYIVAITLMEVVVAYADYQLFFYRNVIALGLLCGLLVRLPMLDKEQKEVKKHESLDDLPTSAQSLVGSRYS